MKPLDPIIEVVRVKFPKYVPIQETPYNAFDKSGALYKKEHYNDYCFAEMNKESRGFIITLFQCDWKEFERIEDEFVHHSFSFEILYRTQAESILYCLT